MSKLKIEILTIGDEILSGRTLNTNATWISRSLFEAGYRVFSQTTLPDQEALLKEGLARALVESDCVIATGGLGPTCDDLTKKVAAELFSSPLQYEEKVASDLMLRFGKDLLSLKEQSTLPVKATLLPNPIGTAYGLLFSEKNKILLLLPGVPQEMKALFQNEVLPFFKRHFPVDLNTHHTLHFSLLYENLVDPTLRDLQTQYPSVKLGIYPDLGKLSVTLQSPVEEEVRRGVERLSSEFAPYLFESPDGQIAHPLQHWFIQEKKTLACAESCTGGRVAAVLTEISGASKYFLGSLVTYSNAWKESFLGAQHTTLLDKGAVSKETVEEMLSGVFAHSQADYAMAVSGIVGPTGGTPEKPVGTVFAALGKRGAQVESGKFFVKGSRDVQMTAVTNILLGLLLRKVTKEIPAFPLFI